MAHATPTGGSAAQKYSHCRKTDGLATGDHSKSKEDYDEIADEIFRLRELRQKTTVDTAARDEQIKRINDLQDYISQQTTYLTEFDESLVRR